MKLSKRLLDLVCTGAGLVVLWPFLVVTAILIKLADGGPVFFRQERIGYKGKPFRMWKFRSMVVDAYKLGKSLTIGTDPRITPLGWWLRRLKIDELPQLFNVVAGDMSLVGPRPEVARYVNLYTGEQRRVLELLPGITDPASVKYYHETELLGQTGDPEHLYIREIMPEKIRINLEYAQRATLLSDVRVILSTFIKIADTKQQKSAYVSLLARQAARNPVVRWSAALLWSALAIYLMVWPSQGTPVGWVSLFFGGTQLTDAVGHVILCGILAWLWYQSLQGSLRPAPALGAALVIGLGLGVGTELAQAFVPSRGASLLDLLANVLGVGLSLGMIGVMRWKGKDGDQGIDGSEP